MSVFSKKVPPPPREPGTHTNSEVKEALKARALRRTIVITAIVILLFAALGVISSRAQEYEGEEDSTSSPKLIWIVASELTPNMVIRAVESNKAPFINILNQSGGTLGKVSAKYDAAGLLLVKLLTGSNSTISETLEGETSVLRELKEKGFKPVVVAPGNYFSGEKTNASAVCEHVGLLDSECLGNQCPKEKPSLDYCNAYRKYISCDSTSQLFRGDIVDSFAKVMENDADILYFQMEGFSEDATASNITHIESKMQAWSDVNLLDNAIGTIALVLAERTRGQRENWLIVVSGDGLTRDNEAPVIMAAYSRGELVQLKPLQTGLHTTDLRGTLLRWFNIKSSNVNASNYIGICSNGINVNNCAST